MEKLILRSYQSPGDVVMLTAAVRDLHAAYPGRFLTDVRTSADPLWVHNPHLTPLDERDSSVRSLDMHYPLIHQSNQRPFHFLHGYVQYLEEQLGLRIPVTTFRGDIHLSTEERGARPKPPGVELPEHYWVIVAGGKYDFTAKWWNPDSYQRVVDHYRGRIQFVQVGEAGHWHPPLQGVINVVGRTSLRELVQLVHFADGVVCPVTLAMHLAAAVEMPHSKAALRPCVVIAGGREPAHWEAYPGHQFLSNVGTLTCCATGGCWRSRCQPVGDGDDKDRRNMCEQPVEVRPDLRIPRCMDAISPEEVIRRIDMYYQGGVLANGNGKVQAAVPAPAHKPVTPPPTAIPAKETISVSFYHGLGDCVYFAHLLPLYVRRGYAVEVECTPDKAIFFEAAGAKVISSGARAAHPWGYPSGGTHEGHGRFWQGSKMGHNISEPPLPRIGDKAELWPEFCDARLDVTQLLSADARRTAQRWLERVPRPVTLLHTKGNTGQERKSLPDDIAAAFYREFLDRCEGSLILMDWDNRVPRLSSYRIRHLSDFGACPTDIMLALMIEADLIIGVDSGPLHAARVTSTPTIGLWMPGHYPSTYSLPRQPQLNVVLREPTHTWNRFKRIPWNIVEHPGAGFRPETLADFARQMQAGPRYLSAQQMGADIQLQQFVTQWCRGVHGNSLAAYCDRNRSLDVLLRETTRRFEHPRIVETGVIRAEEDWPGAGFFTYLAGSYVMHRGGRFDAVDISAANCEFARTWTAVFGEAVRIHQADSVQFLGRHKDAIDVLYLDSLDTTESGHAEHALREAQAALPRLTEKSLIVFDDTPWSGGAWVGKGAQAVPYLLQNGWRVLYGGYQVVLSREEHGP